jgi:hypothetical protein
MGAPVKTCGSNTERVCVTLENLRTTVENASYLRMNHENQKNHDLGGQNKAVKPAGMSNEYQSIKAIHDSSGPLHIDENKLTLHSK